MKLKKKIEHILRSCYELLVKIRKNIAINIVTVSLCVVEPDKVVASS